MAALLYRLADNRRYKQSRRAAASVDPATEGRKS
jgi:hypothetical protein